MNTTKEIYEVLLRFRDGSVVGAHAQDLVCVSEDGKVISEQITHARPIQIGEISGLVDEAAVSGLSILQAEYDELVAKNDLLNKRILDLEAGAKDDAAKIEMLLESLEPSE